MSLFIKMQIDRKVALKTDCQRVKGKHAFIGMETAKRVGRSSVENIF